jgi:hypothetical protein
VGGAVVRACNMIEYDQHDHLSVMAMVLTLVIVSNSDSLGGFAVRMLDKLIDSPHSAFNAARLCLAFNLFLGVKITREEKLKWRTER